MSLTKGGGVFGLGGGRDDGWLYPNGKPQKPSSPYGTYGGNVYDALSRHSDNYLQWQLGMQNQALGLGSRELNAANGFDLARLGIDEQSLGIDRGAVQRQQDYYNQLFGIDTERYNRNVGFQNQLKQFRGKDYGSTLHELWAQMSQVRDKAMREERDMRRTQTAAGAFTSQGSRDSARDIKADKDYALTGLSIDRARADTSYNRDIAGYNNTIADLTSDFKEAGLSHQEQQARLTDRLKTLDLEAQRLGISREELASKLSLGLERLNLNHTMSLGQIIDAMGQNAIGRTENAMNNGVPGATLTPGRPMPRPQMPFS